MLWVNGEIIGTVNNLDIDGTFLHSYVGVTEARTYTAVSKLPPLTGYPMQITVALGEIMGWLFASGTVNNGFAFTGQSSAVTHCYALAKAL